MVDRTLIFDNNLTEKILAFPANTIPQNGWYTQHPTADWDQMQSGISASGTFGSTISGFAHDSFPGKNPFQDNIGVEFELDFWIDFGAAHNQQIIRIGMAEYLGTAPGTEYVDALLVVTNNTDIYAKVTVKGTNIFSYPTGQGPPSDLLSDSAWMTMKVRVIPNQYARMWLKRRDVDEAFVEVTNDPGTSVKHTANLDLEVNAAWFSVGNTYPFEAPIGPYCKVDGFRLYDITELDPTSTGIEDEEGNPVLGKDPNDDGTGDNSGGGSGFGGGGVTDITLVFDAGGYVNAVADDIGKPVLGGTSGDSGFLSSYDNGTRTWHVVPDDAGDTFDSGETVTITGGTGTGVLSADGTTITIIGGLISGEGIPGEGAEGNVDYSNFTGIQGTGDSTSWRGAGSGINLEDWNFRREVDKFGYATVTLFILNGWSGLLASWKGKKLNITEDGVIVFRGYIVDLETPDRYTGILTLYEKHHKLWVLETKRDYRININLFLTAQTKITAVSGTEITVRAFSQFTDILIDGTHGVLIIPGDEPASTDETFTTKDAEADGDIADINNDDGEFISSSFEGVIQKFVEFGGVYSGTQADVTAIRVQIKSSLNDTFEGNSLKFYLWDYVGSAWVLQKTELFVGSFFPLGRTEYTTEFDVTDKKYIDAATKAFNIKAESDYRTGARDIEIFYAEFEVFTDPLYDGSFKKIINKNQVAFTLTSDEDFEAAGINISDTVIIGKRNDLVLAELASEFFHDMTIDVDSAFTGYTASNFLEHHTLSIQAIFSVLKKERGMMYYRPDIDTLFLTKDTNLTDTGIVISNSEFKGGDIQALIRGAQNKQQDEYRRVEVTGNSYKIFDDATKPIFARSKDTGFQTNRVLRLNDNTLNSQTETQMRADSEKALIEKTNMVFDADVNVSEISYIMNDFYPGSLYDIQYHGTLYPDILLRAVSGTKIGREFRLSLHFGWKGSSVEDRKQDQINELRTDVRSLQAGMAIKPAGDLVGLIEKHWHEIASAPDFDTVVWNWITLLDPGSPPSHVPGQIFFDGKVLNVPSTGGANMQVGLETWDFGHNSSGVPIPDGSVVYPMGIVNGLGNARLAKADSLATARHPIAIATVDIADGETGQVTVFGDVNGIDTSGLSLGDVYLSDTVAGGMTSTPPTHPSIRYLIGFCKVVDSVDGVIFVFQDFRDIDSRRNGSMRETMSLTISEAAGVVTANLERADSSGDLTMYFSDGDEILDVTPSGIDIVLSVGTDSVHQENYLYIPQSTKLLTKSETNWPAEQHIKVAFCLVPSAALVASDGLMALQIHNNHDADITTGQGHDSHQDARLRAESARYESGVAPNGATSSYFTLGVGTTDFISTSGVVFQLHEQAIAAFNMTTGDNAHVVNWDGDAFHAVADLFEITEDSTGTVIGANKYFNLVFWMAANKSGTHQPLFVNLPGGFYTKEESAKLDTLKHSDFTIPDEFDGISSVGFRIVRATFQMGATWTLIETESLLKPAILSGGGGSSLAQNEYNDSTFRIFNNADNTKEIAFDASGVTTGNTRTKTYQDTVAGIIAEINQAQDFTVTQTFKTASGADIIIIERTGASAGRWGFRISTSGIGGMSANTLHLRALDAEGDLLITSQANALLFNIDTATKIILVGGSIQPLTANAINLGSTALEWRALYLAEGANSGLYLGLAQDARIWFDNANNLLRIAPPNLKLGDTAIIFVDFTDTLQFRDPDDAYVVLMSLVSSAGSRLFKVGLATDLVPFDLYGTQTMKTASDTDNIAMVDNAATADYGAAWASVNLPSAPAEGMTVHRWNSNGGVAAGRTYTYLNGAWRYVDLT